MTPLRRILLLVAAAAGLAGAGGYALKATQRSQAASTGDLAAPAMVPRVMALGRLEPVSEVMRIAAPAAQDSGRLAEINIIEGDWVEKGRVIAVLDTRARLSAALRQSEATLELRKSALAKTIADLDNQERTLTAALEQQEAQRDRAKWDFDRLQQLQKSGLYREAALIDKRLALDGANHALDSAGLLLERNLRRDANGIRIDEASARSDVAAAEAALARARADLEFSLIRSPVTGRVLRRMGRLGEQIGQDGFAEIADTRVMMVRSEVFESDFRRVRIGGAVSVASRALSGQLNGVVDRVGLKVNRQTMVGEDPAATLDARVIEVMIRLDPHSSERAAALTGLQVRVSFAPEEGS
jgi:HlyD family secretion protein